RDFAANNAGTQSPATLERNYAAVAGQWAAREHDAGTQRVDHALDDDGHRELRFRQTETQAVTDRLGVVQTGPAQLYRFEHGLFVAHPQIGILQTGEAGVFAVFAGGAGPHGHRMLSLFAERAVGGTDLC